MAVHPGLRLFFDPLVRLSRVAGPLKPVEGVDSTGFNGVVDYELTGAGGATWHCNIRDAGITFGRGATKEPRATVSMSVETFFKLLRGELSYTVAQMTGRVRVRGDGHAAIVFGAVITQFREPVRRDLQGLLRGAWKWGVLAASRGKR
jgi:putative sterol carrier protein